MSPVHLFLFLIYVRELVTRSVKGVQFVSGRYTKAVILLSNMAYKLAGTGTRDKAAPYITSTGAYEVVLTEVKSSSPGRPAFRISLKKDSVAYHEGLCLMKRCGL